jgi:hypothetical protein
MTHRDYKRLLAHLLMIERFDQKDPVPLSVGERRMMHRLILQVPEQQSEVVVLLYREHIMKGHADPAVRSSLEPRYFAQMRGKYVTTGVHYYDYNQALHKINRAITLTKHGGGH